MVGTIPDQPDSLQHSNHALERRRWSGQTGRGLARNLLLPRWHLTRQLSSNAAWYVFFAQNLQATIPGSQFSQTTATPIVHYGGVCESGVTCSGNRDLYDDFGVAASPTTGLASIIYSDDQYSNTPTQPAGPGCTSSRSNTSYCDST